MGEISLLPRLTSLVMGKLPKKLNWTFQAVALMELRWFTITHGSLVNWCGSMSVFSVAFSKLY